MAKENKALLRRRKGWKGYVQSYNNYIENGSYDKIKWDGETKGTIIHKDDFKTIIKY